MRKMTLLVCFVVAAMLPAGPSAVADDCPEGSVCQTADFIDLGLGRDAWLCQNGPVPGIGGVCFSVESGLRSVRIDVTRVAPPELSSSQALEVISRSLYVVFEDCRGNELDTAPYEPGGTYDAPEGTCRIGLYSSELTDPQRPPTIERVGTIEYYGNSG